MERSFLKHHLLIAMPGLGDPNFEATVTYLFEHDETQALGLVVNRPMRMLLGDVLEQMQIRTALPEVAQTPVHYGGPVQPERGFVLHEAMDGFASSLAVGENLMLTTSRDVLECIADGRGPRRRMLLLGYAGWGAGQLEMELAQNAWLSVPASTELLFDVPSAERWQRAAQRLGVDLALLSSTAGHA